MQQSAAPVLQLLLTVLAPPPGVVFAVQRGRDELLPPYASDVESVAFAITMRLGPPLVDGAFNFRGPYAQGAPADRFIYLNSGTLAGQSASCWERRAKVKLAAIPRPLIESAVGDPACAIEARILGTAGDGGPVCASIRPHAISWRLTVKL
ncbi:DUF5990 family protein [Pelomonas aquatica]|jgi:hypothetical protein|nr:DUF5990 family protein [Pelomonas aquatica]MCY4756763.1 DUF5990 family protein [Pelomonas aquatica]